MNKNSYKIGIILVFFILSVISCDQGALEYSQDFVANRAPVIASFISDRTETGNLLPNMSIHLTLEASDPDGDDINFEFSATTGSFFSQEKTNTGATVTLILPNDLPAGIEIIVTATASDKQGAASSLELNLGSTKSGPSITLLSAPSKSYLKPTDAASISFSADSDGFYQLQLIDDSTCVPVSGQSLFNSTDPSFFYKQGTVATVDIGGPLATGVDLKLNPEGYSPDKVRVVFVDSLWQEDYKEFTFYVDGTAPVLISPIASTSAFIQSSDAISITFSEPVAIAACSGDMQSSGCVSSAGTDYATTHLISATGLWTADATGEKTLTLNMTDMAGNVIVRDFTYRVFNEIRHVISDGDIQAAIDAITAFPGAVLVSAGTYAKSDVVINMKNNVSVYGGFSPTDWNVRSPETYKTIVQNIRSTGATCNAPRLANPAVAIVSLTTSPSIDGFYIIGGNDSVCSAGINANYNTGNGPIIRNNTIFSGTGDYNRAIDVYNSDLQVYNNTIETNASKTPSYGINYLVTDGAHTVKIRNNTINAICVDSNSTNINLFVSGTAGITLYLDNNILLNTRGLATYGLYTFKGTSATLTFASVKNNAFLGYPGGSTLAYINDDPPTGYTNITTFNSSIPNAANNYQYDSSDFTTFFTDIDGADDNINTVLDNNWRLSASAPVELRTGGYDGNLLWDVLTDKDGVLRTAGWSMGAYEY